MTTERRIANKTLMRKWVRMFETGNLSDATALIDVEYIDHQGLGGTPLSGPDGFRQVVTAARQACSSLRVSIEDLIAEGDRVVARVRWSGKHPAGEPIDGETIDYTCQFATPDALWDGFLGASVRIAALITEQPPEVQKRIREAFDRLVATYLTSRGLEIPVSVKLVRGEVPRA